MAKYIELMGLPGAGKSTTYGFLRAKHNKNENWILFEELCGSRPRGLKGAIEYHVKKLIRPNGKEPLLEVRSDRDAFNRFIKNNPKLIELFWQAIAKEKNTFGRDLRFHAAEYILQILEKTQRVSEKKSDKYCIVDEGLIHNINYFLNQNVYDPTYKQHVSNVLDLMPLPFGVVYFGGDIDTIMDRTFNRGFFTQRDRNLSPEGLKKSRELTLKEKQTYLEIVRSSNIPVLYLDCTDSVSTKAQKITSFIKQIV